MTTTTLQYPGALTANSIQRNPAFKPVKTKENPIFLLAYAISAVLGFVFGLSMAVYFGPALGPAASFNSETANSSIAGPAGPIAAATISQPPSLQSQANTGEGSTSSALLPAVLDRSQARESSVGHPRHSVRLASARTRFHARFKNLLRRHSTAFRHTRIPVALPAATELARFDDAARPASFFIEGDASVADYDASLGTIETHEGKTFTVARTTNEGNALPWPDFLSSVHYRCDQSGNCTLFHAGITVSNVRTAS